MLTIGNNHRAIEFFGVIALGAVLVCVLELCQTSSAIVLRATSTLLVSKMLTSPRCEETWWQSQHKPTRYWQPSAGAVQRRKGALTDMFSILHASPHLGRIVGAGEGIFFSAKRACSSVEDLICSAYSHNL